MKDVLALIPARGGSKGLPGKNLRLLHGHPLVAYAVAAALASRRVGRVICSTDDPRIAEAALRYGAEVPFLRPPELARDETPDLPVFQHALQWLREREGYRPQLVVQLRPTSPVRLPGQVDQAVEMLLKDPKATAVRSVCPAPANPYKMWRGTSASAYLRPLLRLPGIREPYDQPRQELPPVWWQTGTIDVARSKVIEGGSMTGKRILPLPVEARCAVDIDDELSLRLAELVMEEVACVRPEPGLDWSRIRVLALDVDGTLTPGTIYYTSQGEELKRFHTHDGHGIGLLQSRGVEVAIISAENSPAVSARARKLAIREVHLGVRDKLSVLRRLCRRRDLDLAEVAYVGDDLGDLEVMLALARAGGIPCAVANARPEIQRVARYHCRQAGGEGAVREVCDLILQTRQKEAPQYV